MDFLHKHPYFPTVHPKDTTGLRVNEKISSLSLYFSDNGIT